MKKLRAPKWFAVGLLPLLAGCSNSPYPSGEAATSTLFLAFGTIISLDPSVSYNVDDGVIMDQIYPSFYRFHYLKRPSQLELNIGAAEPEIRKRPGGGEDWTFRIRKDIRFQNDACFEGGKGRGVVANDIVYAFKRFSDPSLQCPFASVVADKIVGWNEYAKGFEKAGNRHYDTAMPGVTLDPNDPYKFTVHLTQAYPQLRYLMAMHFTTPIPREAVERYGNAFGVSHPVGCGAYRLEEYQPGRRLVLVANENMNFSRYPSEGNTDEAPEMLHDAGQPLPITKRIVYSHIKEPLSAYNLFQQGYLDVIGCAFSTAQVMPAATSLTPGMQAHGVQRLGELIISADWLAFNMKDPVFGGYTDEKRKLRQAISLSIDADAYIDIICQGMGRPSEYIVAPGLDGYDAHYRNPNRRFDPSLKRAKQLLAEAGYANGIDPATGEKLTLRLLNFATTPSLRQMIRLFVAQIQALGIRVESQEFDTATFTARLKAGQYQSTFGNWWVDYPDSENLLQLDYGLNAMPGPGDANYSNKEYDRLFERIRAMKSGPERERLIHRMRDIVVADCPRIYLSHMEFRTLSQPWVKNAKLVTVGNEMHQYYGVDPEMRVRMQAKWNQSSKLPLAGMALIGAAFSAPALIAVSKRRNRKVRR